MIRSGFRWWLLLLLLLAFLLRGWNLGGKSLWLDEAFVVWNAERSPAEIWAETNDNHPPLYYLMLHHWIKVGRDESWLRVPSVLAGMLSLALTFALSRRLFGEGTAWTAAVLLAAAPLSIWYAQEARMVIFVVPFALMAALGLARGDWKGWLLLILGLGGGLYFDYTIIPLWVIVSSLWLEAWWRSGRSRKHLLLWFVSSLTGWLLFWPLWPHLAVVLGRLGNIFIIANIREQLELPELGGLVYLFGLFCLGVLTFAAGLLWQRLVERPFLCQLMTITLLVGFAGLTLLAPVPRLYSVKRVVVTAWPLVIILTAVAANWLRPEFRWVKTGLAAVSLAAAFAALWLVPKDDWRGAVNYINQHGRSGDIVWLAPASGQNPYHYYQGKIPPEVGPALMSSSPPAETWQANIWHIAERQPGTPIPNGPVESWLDENRPLLEVIPFYRLEVRHYGAVSD